MSAYTEHLQTRERDAKVMQAIADFYEPLDAIAAKFEDPDEKHWRRRMALEIKHLREELKRRA